MIRFVTALRGRESQRRDFWLSGQFDRRPHADADRAVAAWTEFMGRQSAELWLDARNKTRT